MLSLFGDLFSHYIHDAWGFAILHLLFLLLFLYRWRQSWSQVGDLLHALQGKPQESHLLDYATEQIRRYAEQGREPDLPRIERSIIGRFDRDPEIIRALINTFVVIGLMGTLFSLFAMGHQPQEIRETKQILSRMGVAFSTSFFGILWALGCSVLLLNPLRRRTTKVIQEVDRRLTEISVAYPPRVPERAIEQIAQTLRDNVDAIGGIIQKFQLQEEAHLISSRELLTDFRDTTRSVVMDLATKVEDIQTRTEGITISLKESVISSLNDLKNRFLDISKSWQGQMQKTILASEKAATKLSESSQNLTESTKDVSDSLKSVRDSLERTKSLAEIVVNIERLTSDYLEQTSGQIQVFKAGLDATLDNARAIPDEWFTMLTLVSDDLAKRLGDTTAGWEAHIDNTGNILAARVESMGNDLGRLSESLGRNGQLAKLLGDLNDVLVETKSCFEQRMKTDGGSQFDSAMELVRKLEQILVTLNTKEVPTPLSPVTPTEPNGLVYLSDQVEGIRKVLDDLITRWPSDVAVPFELSSSSPRLTSLESPHETVANENSPPSNTSTEIFVEKNEITLRPDHVFEPLGDETNEGKEATVPKDLGDAVPTETTRINKITDEAEASIETDWDDREREASWTTDGKEATVPKDSGDPVPTETTRTNNTTGEVDVSIETDWDDRQREASWTTDGREATVPKDSGDPVPTETTRTNNTTGEVDVSIETDWDDHVRETGWRKFLTQLLGRKSG